MKKFEVLKGDFGEVRFLLEEGKTWFIGNDIAKCLGYTKPTKAIGKHVSSNNKKMEMVSYGAYGNQNTAIISEKGLRQLLSSCGLKTTNGFKKWINEQIVLIKKENVKSDFVEGGTPLPHKARNIKSVEKTYFDNFKVESYVPKAQASELQIIDEREVLGKEFRIYGSIENPLFLAKDVAEWIDYNEDKVGQMLSSVDEDEKKTSPIYYSGQVRNMWVLTEDGLYEVLMQSRKPIAKHFKKEVKEILKSIRKHGAYMTVETIEKTLTSPDFLMKLATTLKEEKEKRQIAEQQIEKQKPLVNLSETIITSSGAITVSNLAKMLKNEITDIGQNKLFAFFKYKKIIQQNKQTPYQKYINKGYFEVRQIVKEGKTKEGKKWKKVVSVSFITTKGQLYLTTLVRSEYIDWFLNVYSVEKDVAK